MSPVEFAVKFKPDYQMITAAAAALISVCALALSFSELSLLGSEQRAQVWPYIDIAISYGQDGFGVTLANKGTGPALIKSVAVKNEAQTVLSWQSLIDQSLGGGSGEG